MVDDLKIIKKQFGEAMMHLCREEFPTILEQPGALSNILLSHFRPSRFLYRDIINRNYVDEFKNYIYSIFDSGIREVEENIPTPEELLDKAGYILYECLSESDIQAFKKYYKPREELCTFKDERLKRYYVFFAVKKNVAEIKRENFPKPQRQDEYGTSVISIQFSKNENHLLSIKNRYNHSVAHCDATFSNNLDNIIPGLTDSFAIHYGLTQKYVNNFCINGYVLANDGKYYKYNYEVGNVYYCPNNIVIVNGAPITFDKEKYIVMDYFVLNLVTKEIISYDNTGVNDSFPNSIGKIKKITIQKDGGNKRIIITPEIGENISILLDETNCIVEYINPNITVVGNRFLRLAKHLKRIEIKKAKIIGDGFCKNAIDIEEIELPEAEMIGSLFLSNNYILKRIYIPKVKIIRDDFCYRNDVLEEIDCPSLKKVSHNFISNNMVLKRFFAPKLKQVGSNFCYSNNEMEIIEFPSLEIIGSSFFEINRVVRKLIMPNASSVFNYYFASHMEYKNALISPEDNEVTIEHYEDVFARIRAQEE